MSGRKVTRSFAVEEEIDRTISHISVDLGVRKSELYELGARLVLAFAKVGYVPDDCSVLAAVEPGLVERLQELLARAGWREPPTSSSAAASVEAEA